MLFPYTQRFLFNAETDQGANPDTLQGQNKEGDNKGAEKLFTQEEVNRLASKEKKEGKTAAEKAILEALGIASIDEAKAIVEAKRKADESAKSETEKLQELLAQKDREIQEAKSKAEQAEKRRMETIRDSAIRSALSDAHDVDSTLLVFQAKNAASIESLLDESGVVDSKALDVLMVEFRANNAYLFKGNGKGSPSNAEGRLLKPESDTRKQVEAEIAKKFRP